MRFPDWKARLTAYLADCAQRQYEPGTHDCALFPAGAVLAMTGLDHAAGFRGSYTTLEAGFKAMKKAGYRDHIDFAARHFDEIPPAFAAPGDLAVLDGPLGASLGVVQGEGVFVLTATRMGLLPLTSATRAFKVI